jgi:hypothetical protein
MTKTRSIPPVYQDHLNIDIHIDIHASGHQYEIDIKGAAGGKTRRKVDMFQKDLYDLNNRMRDAFREVAFGESLNPDTIQRLAREGHNAFLQIFDKNARALFKDLLSFYKNSVIEITTEDFFLPWELLYIESTDEPFSIDNFLGARHVISRIIDLGNSPFISPYIFQQVPRIGLSTDDSLEYVRTRETPFFEQLDTIKKITLFKLEILNPDRKEAGMDSFEIFLTSHMEIAHFACHAVGNQNEHSQSSMIVSDEFEISLSDLRMLDSLEMADNPIVVLNACGTGNINSEHSSFFAKEFLKFGARGVIATDCEIPDYFAAEFTKQFYPELLNGTPIGEALFKTRRYFLEKRNNITTLIYSMYASPMIKIANRQITPWTGDKNG